ncbi:hypothetical protein FQN49_007710, partial [Arthroderma sp. PD_2]
KIKRSHERTTGLKEVSTAQPAGYTAQPPTEPTTDVEMDVGKEALMGDKTEVEPKYKDLDPDVDDPEDDEDALEREMLAAFDDDQDWDEDVAEDDGDAN